MSQDVGPECRCNPRLLAIKRTSHTAANPGRDFFTCPKNSNDPACCKFFKWVDDYEREHRAEIEHELHSAFPSQLTATPPSTAPSSLTQATAFNLSQQEEEEEEEEEPEERPVGFFVTQEQLEAIIRGMPPTVGSSRVPSTPRRSTVERIPQLPATPQSLPKKHTNKSQTPEQREKRLHELQRYLGESSEPRNSATPRPLGSIDDALDKARVLPSTNASSPLKRTHVEMSSSDEEAEYWLMTSETLGGRPSKVQKASADSSVITPTLLPASEIKGKGKGREVSVGQAGPSRLPSDPENPFEIKNANTPTSSQSSATLTPPTTPSKFIADELEKQAQAFLKAVDDVRKLERRSVAHEKSKTAKESANKRLREELKEKDELLDAQNFEISELNKLVAVLKGRIRHLEELVEGCHVRRDEDILGE